MKNILLLQIIFPIIFAFIFSACSDFSGNEDAVEASLKPGPVTQQQQEEEEEEEEESVPTRTYYDLEGITFGNNKFVAVGKSGVVRTSSDNGTSWDNGTSGTTRTLYEIAYGNSTFVAVGDSGTHLYSRDNGGTWSTGTWSENDRVTGVAFGNNTFIGVSIYGEYVTKSVDNGSNWSKKAQGIAVYDVTYGNSKFVASGDNGAIAHSSNDGENWSTGESRTSTAYLYGITFGNNRFLTVGASGWLSYSSDNGSDFTALTIPLANTLYSTAYGNNIFVSVGYYSVVVSDNDMSEDPILKENSYYFNDVTFGNGVFVAVGDDEIIYTSTDGDTWTKVHGKP